MMCECRVKTTYIVVLIYFKLYHHKQVAVYAIYYEKCKCKITLPNFQIYNFTKIVTGIKNFYSVSISLKKI